MSQQPPTMIFFIPAEGVTVFNPVTKQAVDAKGELVEDTIYFRRRVADGSGTISEPEQPKTSKK